MTIHFILNGEDITFRSEANVRLIEILRVHLGLTGSKAGCLTGKCGACTVLFNGSVINACLIPAFRLHGGEIITIEGFELTAEYQDIAAGFSHANLDECGYCRTSKILNAHALLERKKRPQRHEIVQAFSGIKCRCNDPEKLVESVERTIEIRQRRLYGRSV